MLISQRRVQGQSINHSIIQSFERSINQSINQSLDVLNPCRKCYQQEGNRRKHLRCNDFEVFLSNNNRPKPMRDKVWCEKTIMIEYPYAEGDEEFREASASAAFQQQRKPTIKKVKRKSIRKIPIKGIHCIKIRLQNSWMAVPGTFRPLELFSGLSRRGIGRRRMTRFLA